MARRGQPVLYELLGAVSAPSPRPSGDAGSDSLAPLRQSIRVPIGWLWLAVVVALAMMAVAYQFGRAAGDRAGYARGQDWKNDGEVQRQLAASIPDPDRAPPPAPVVDRGTKTAGKEPAPPPRGNADPRQRGLNYWVVARTSAEEAARLAPFVQSNGLEVAVVPDNNPRFVRVVAIPGVTEGRSSETARRQEARIKSIGKLWKNAARGNRDFDDTYLELYR